MVGVACEDGAGNRRGTIEVLNTAAVARETHLIAVGDIACDRRVSHVEYAGLNSERPVLEIPPPSEPAELPLMVLFITVSDRMLRRPPASYSVATFPLIVLRLMVISPPLSQIPPR